MKISDFLLSYTRIEFSEKCECAFFDYVLKCGIDVWGYRRTDNGFSVKCRKKYRKQICDVFGKSITESRDGGLIVIKKFVLSHAGITLGLIAFIIISYLSGSVLWDVRISGNDMTDDDRILTALEAAGVRPGAKISALETSKISVKFLSEVPEVSYITININGNVAYVDIIEAVKPEEKADKSRLGANVTAKSDGIIESITVTNGRAVVSGGKVVRKGELLISGISDGQNGSRISYAEGEVLARVSHDFIVEVPLTGTGRVYDSEKTVGYDITFFGHNISILKYNDESERDASTGKKSLAGYDGKTYGKGFIFVGKLLQNNGKYVTMESKEQLSIFGFIDLPVYTRKITAFGYYEKETEISRENAVKLAYRRLGSDISSTLSGAMIVSKSTEGYFSDGRFVLKSTVVCIENIAETVEFEKE